MAADVKWPCNQLKVLRFRWLTTQPAQSIREHGLQYSQVMILERASLGLIIFVFPSTSLSAEHQWIRPTLTTRLSVPALVAQSVCLRVVLNSLLLSACLRCATADYFRDTAAVLYPLQYRGRCCQWAHSPTADWLFGAFYPRPSITPRFAGLIGRDGFPH